MNAMRFARLLAAPLAASSLALCQLIPANAASTVPLHYTFKNGQTAAYAITVKVKQVFVTQRSSFGDQLTLTQRVVSAAANGSALLQLHYSKSTLGSNGQVVPLNLAAVIVNQHLARDGSVLSTVTRGISAQNNLTYLASGVNTHPILPKKAMAVGQSWTIKQQVALGHLGVFALSQRFQLKALKTQGGHIVAQIAVSSSQPVHTKQGQLVENGTIGSSGTIQFDTTSGVLSALHEQVTQNVKATAASGASKGNQATITFTATVDVVMQK